MDNARRAQGKDVSQQSGGQGRKKKWRLQRRLLNL
jgi:hypothetical protein